MFSKLKILFVSILFILTGCVSKGNIDNINKCDFNIKELLLHFSYFKVEKYDSDWITIKLEFENPTIENINVKITNYYLYNELDKCKYKTSIRNNLGEVSDNKITIYRKHEWDVKFTFHVQQSVEEDNCYFNVVINNERFKLYLDEYEK